MTASSASYDAARELRERLREECPSRRVEPLWAPATREHAECLELEISRRERSPRPWALLVDDGELDDVCDILEELGTPALRLRSDAAGSGWRQPRRLLVVSGSRALTLTRPTAQEGDGFATVVVLDRPSNSVRRGVAVMGFDYVIERPVDGEALRVVLQRALFGGREKRGEPRFALGWAVPMRAGWRSQRAKLIELSRFGGCLLADTALRAGARVSVRLPSELTGGEPLSLSGRISRAEHRSIHGPCALAVVWSGHPHTRPRLGALLAKLRRGPLPLP